MRDNPPGKIEDGVFCNVIGGVHAGKSGTIGDVKTGKTGFVSVTVTPRRGDKFKTLSKNVIVQARVK
jgi:ribosomal protein S4E